MGGSALYSCTSDMAIAREAGRTKMHMGQDGKMVMCDYSPLTPSKRTYATVQIEE